LTWSDVAIAAAFVLGATAGVIATIRLMRYLLTYLRKEGHDE